MPAVKGRMQQRGVARREAILAAAVELMASRGFRGTSLAAVADAVGVTEAGVLHYFASRDEILMTVLDERRRLDSPALREWASLSGMESIRRLPDLARRIASRPVLARLYIVLQVEHLDDDGAVHAWFLRRATEVRKFFADMLRAGVESGEFRPDVDAARKAAQIVAFLDGIQLHWLLSPRAIDLVAAYEEYTAALLRDLCA